MLLQEAQTYAQENGLFFLETSAKTADNVNDIFYEIGTFLVGWNLKALHCILKEKFEMNFGTKLVT